MRSHFMPGQEPYPSAQEQQSSLDFCVSVNDFFPPLAEVFPSLALALGVQVQRLVV